MESKQVYEQITFDNLEKYRLFDTVGEMDEKIYEYINVLRLDEQLESVIEVLRFLGRSSLRVLGVSFAKYQTIADNIGKSISTVKRAIKTLKEYGIIETVPTVKKWLGRGKSRRRSVNIVVIQPHVNHQNEPSIKDEEAYGNKAEEVENETEPSFINHNSTSHTRDADAGKRGLKSAIPQVIYEALAPFYDAEGLYNTYGILLRAKAAIDRNITVEEYGDEYVDVFLNAVRLRKLGKIWKSFEGLLYASWERLTAEISRRVNASDSISTLWVFEDCMV